jgi:hypothetical protein
MQCLMLSLLVLHADLRSSVPRSSSKVILSKGAQRSLWLNNPIAIYALIIVSYSSSCCHLLYHLKKTSYTLFFTLLSILCALFSVQVCCASSLGITELRQKLWSLECCRNFVAPRISKRKFTPQSANTPHVVHCISIHSVPASCPQIFLSCARRGC